MDSQDFFGWSVSSLGDLNQDSIPDIIVGAPNDGFFFSFFLIFFLKKKKMMEILQIQLGILELFIFSFLKFVEMEKLEELKIVMMEILKI